MLRPLYVALSLFPVAPSVQADAAVALPLFNPSKDRSVDWVGESAAENIIEPLHLGEHPKPAISGHLKTSH